MAWRELIFSALFLYIISPTAYTETCQCYPSANNLPGDNRPPGGKCCTLYPGMAQIHYNNGNTTTMICSGFLIKFWVVLSVATYVNGTPISNLSVKISEDPLWNTIEVEPVTQLFVHPYYKNGSLKYNFALIFIQNPSTTTRTYKPYPYDISPHELLKDKTRIFVNEWQKLPKEEEEEERLVAYGQEIYAMDDFNICGESAPLNDSYCLFRKGYNISYTQRDLGLPVYFINSWEVTALGIYMGIDKGNKTTGHLFQKIYPAVPWINQVLNSSMNLEVDDDCDDSCTNDGFC